MVLALAGLYWFNLFKLWLYFLFAFMTMHPSIQMQRLLEFTDVCCARNEVKRYSSLVYMYRVLFINYLVITGCC